MPLTSHIDHKGRLKVVRYWAMYAIAGTAVPRNEVDAVRWVRLDVAERMLTYERDRALLKTFRTRLSGSSGTPVVERVGGVRKTDAR